MSLHVGDRLGPYQILAAIGAGGMGEVYRGRDTRLDRDVAIKVLPDAVAQDPERLARFEREAKMLAALNHPHIAQIYGVEGPALAMEFVEGEDLSARIARGPIAVDDAVEIAGGIAAALEAAHELGIVHRDLKASNIRLRPDGTVKVLDFGLAKALAPAVALFETASAPTITTPAMTQHGVVLGTAAYMSPEQAKGKPIDKRADIWAFGVVLYEMVTGRRPFEGETVSESLAGVLKSEPDWTPVPAEVRRLLRSCFEKDPRKRLRDIGDWRRQLDDPAAISPRLPGKPPWVPWGMASMFALAAGLLAFAYWSRPAPVAEPVSFEIPPPPTHAFDNFLEVSPDGRRIAFTAMGVDNVVRIWVRDLGAVDARPIAGTEGARNVTWSPDGKSIGFAVGHALKRSAIDGSPPLTVYESDDPDSLGASAWSPHGVIVIGGFRRGAMRLIRESGGVATPLTDVDSSRHELAHGIPSFLPDGRHFLYVRVGTDAATSGLFVGSIDKKPEEQSQTRLLGTSHATFVGPPRGPGALLYLRQDTLVSHPFDPESLRFSGDPVPLAEGVGNYGALGFFSARAGTIAYRRGERVGGGRLTQLTWLDRGGKSLGTVGAPTAYDALELSPDGSRAAVVQVELSDSGLGNIDVWVVDLRRGVAQRLTSDPAVDRWPVWSPRGDELVLSSTRSGYADLFVAGLNAGAEKPLLKSDRQKTATSWSSDGRAVLFHSGGRTNSDLWLLPLSADRQPVPIAQTTFSESDARFSPDTKWIAYTSNVSGRQEVYVRPFSFAAPASTVGVIRVSNEGGRFPRWRSDSRELIYQNLENGVIAVDLIGDATSARPGTPHELFTLPPRTIWDVTADGQRFLATMPTSQAGLAPITVLLNRPLR